MTFNGAEFNTSNAEVEAIDVEDAGCHDGERPVRGVLGLPESEMRRDEEG